MTHLILAWVLQLPGACGDHMDLSAEYASATKMLRVFVLAQVPGNDMKRTV